MTESSQMGNTPAERRQRPIDWTLPLLGFVLVVAFFLAHQAWSTGFFNANFDIIESVLFYGVFLSVALQTILPVYLTRRRAAIMLYWAAASFCVVATGWLLVRFPFNFTHLTDVMPVPTRFLLNWITNELGQILVILLLVGADALILFDLANYRSQNHSTGQ